MSKKFINFNDEDSLGKYFKEIRKSTILTQKEEIDLAKKIKRGNQNAINRLVNANLKFVVSMYTNVYFLFCFYCLILSLNSA